MHKPGLVVVGSGPAGLSAAETFRRHHPGIPVYVLTADAALPYARPPLSKEFLRGEQTDVGLHPQGWFDDGNIEVITINCTVLIPSSKVKKVAPYKF